MQQVIPDISGLFPGCVVTVSCRIEDTDQYLHPDEETAVRNAVTSRRREFAAGRECARQALMRLGVRNHPLIKSGKGFPEWPQGIVGAVSHSDSVAGAAVARSDDVLGVGLDIENAGRMNRRIAERVLTPEEITWASSQSASEFQRWCTMMFSAKESVYKCVYPLVHQWIDFMDAVVFPHPDDCSFDVKLTDKFCDILPSKGRLGGRYLFAENHVFTGVLLA